uniref:Uncharacterized protein n=1 Tax=Anguilla anguilla TaxID=7936 RepID=A0A0E9W6M9_ANGAN
MSISEGECGNTQCLKFLCSSMCMPWNLLYFCPPPPRQILPSARKI